MLKSMKPAILAVVLGIVIAPTQAVFAEEKAAEGAEAPKKKKIKASELLMLLHKGQKQMKAELQGIKTKLGQLEEQVTKNAQDIELLDQEGSRKAKSEGGDSKKDEKPKAEVKVPESAEEGEGIDELSYRGYQPQRYANQQYRRQPSRHETLRAQAHAYAQQRAAAQAQQVQPMPQNQQQAFQEVDRHQAVGQYSDPYQRYRQQGYAQQPAQQGQHQGRYY